MEFLKTDIRNLHVELKNARFTDVKNHRYYPEGTRLIIYNGRIEHIISGEEGNCPYPVDFTIDLKGKTVIPGLFNTHCHIQMSLPTTLNTLKELLANKIFSKDQIDKNMYDCLLHGVVHVRDAWTDSLKANKELKKRIERKSIKGPRIYESVLIGPENGNFTTKRNRFVRFGFSARNMPTVDFGDPDSGVISVPMAANKQDIKDAVDKAIDERGAQYIKIYEQKQDWFTGNYDANYFTDEQLYTLVEHAHGRGVKTTIHHVTLESLRKALKAGIWSVAHLTNNTPLTEEDMEAVIRTKTVIEPTLSVMYYLCWKIKGDEFENHRRIEKLTEFRNQTYMEVSNDFWLPNLHDYYLRGIESANTGIFKIMGLIDTSPLFRVYARSILTGIDNLATLYKNGGLIGCGNDAGAICATCGMIHHELSMINLMLGLSMEDFTLPGSEALKIATLNSAHALGLDDDYGSIDENKVADLAVINGDPLADFNVIGKKVAALFMDGNLVMDHIFLKPEATTAVS